LKEAAHLAAAFGGCRRAGVLANSLFNHVPAWLLAAIGTTPHAQSEKTRERVKAEYAKAVGTGSITRRRSDMKLDELYPQRYPQAPAAVGLSHAQVKADLAEAIRNGDIVASGESGLKPNQELPQRYPAVVVVASERRAQVNAETPEAVRTGDMVATGEGTMKLNEEFPQCYARAHALYASKAQGSTAISAKHAGALTECGRQRSTPLARRARRAFNS
jgi:hypothetical protein